jgi:hypothetical protein
MAAARGLFLSAARSREGATDMSKTDFQEAANLNALTGIYAGLLVGATDPTVAALEGGTATEASYSGYARLSCALGTLTGSGDDASTPSTRANTAELKFAAVAGADIKVRHVGFYDAASAGNMLYFTDTDLNTSVAVGVNPDFAIGALTVVEK